MAKINIYADCSCEQPTKTYECRRVLFGVAKKALSLGREMGDNVSEDKAFELTGKLIQLIFPQITAEELDYMDIVEMKEFAEDIFNLSVNEVEKAQKN